MKHELRLFFIALQFFTRLPVPAWVGYQPNWLNESARHFPAVGILVGGAGALALWAAALVFPPPVAAWISIATSLVLTGAFHEDGLADTFDGLGGVVPRARALEIMKDSRLGTYGAIALIVCLALKAQALGHLPIHRAVPALVLAHALSRTAAVALIRFLPYAGDAERAKAKPLAERISSVGLAVAAAWALLVALAVGHWQPQLRGVAMASLPVSAVVALGCGRWFLRRVGGFTGDLLGATQQLAELAVLLLWMAWFDL